MRKVLMKCLVMMAACLLFLQTSFDSTAADPEKNEAVGQYHALERLNDVRHHLNLNEITFSKELGSAAESHSIYMDALGMETYEELPGDSGFIGVYPRDRAKTMGYPGSFVTEQCGFRMSTYTGFINWCLQDPMLRTQLLRPGVREIGMGSEGVYFTMDFGAEAYNGPSQVLVYPYPGQQNVENVTMAELSYVPEDMKYNQAFILGTPITVQYEAPDLTDVSFANVQIWLIDTKKNRRRACVKVLPSEERLWNTMIIYPMRRYAPNVKYTVEVSFDVYDGETYLETIQKEWSFTSAGPDFIGEVRMERLDEMMAERFGLDPFVDEEAGYAEPGGFVTREQAMGRMIDCLMILDPELVEAQVTDYKNTFEDINQCEESYREAVQIAYQLGIARDQGAGIFNPRSYITQKECEEALDRIAELLNR